MPGLVDLGHLAADVDGVDRLRETIARFDPLALPHAGHRACARDASRGEIAAEPRALVYGRVGACTQELGGLTIWLIYCLNLLTGHLDSEGGMMFAEAAVDLTRAYGSKGHYGKFRSRVRTLPEFGNELPVATLADGSSPRVVGR